MKKSGGSATNTPARFSYDLDAIFDDIKKSEKELGLPLVTLPPNRVAKRGSARDKHGDEAA